MSEAFATQQQIIEYRARIRAGEELSEDELRAAWAAFRQSRSIAASMATKRRASRAAKPVRSTSELTALFGNTEVG